MHTMDRPDLAPFAERVQGLVPEGAYQMLARSQALEAAGRDIIHLEAGQPDVLAFDNIVQAGIRAIEAGHARYGPPAGLPALRKAIAEDAGPSGGTVTVRTERDSEGEGGVAVTVEDEGVGMDARTLDRAADEFFTTKATGTGL